MPYSIDNIPLSSESLIEIDLSGDHNFASVVEMKCQIGTANFTTAEHQTVTLSDRCGGRVVRKTGRIEGPDQLAISMIYVDPVSASNDEYDDILAAKGDTVAVRVYPGGKETNRRYGQIIGVLKNVGVAGIGASDTDFNFDASIDGVVTVAKGA